MLKQKFILGYSSKLFVQFITIVASIFVARIVGPTVMGTVAWALAYGQMLIFIADLGLGAAHIKMISEGQDAGKCIATYSVLKLSTIGLYLVTFTGYFLFTKYILHKQYESQIHEYALFISVGVLLIQEVQNIAVNTFMAKTEQAKQELPYILKNIIFQIARIVIVIVGGKAIALVFGNLFATLLIFPFYIYLFKKYPMGKFDSQLAKRYIKIGAPLFFVGLAASLTDSIDKVLLQEFANSEQVGYYVAGFRIGGFILLIQRSMSLLFFPMFSAAYAKGDFNYIKEKINKFEHFSFLYILPVVILIVLYARDVVILLLGWEYLPSIDVMAIVTVALFLNVFNTPFGNVLAGLGKFKLAAIITFVNLVIYIVTICIFLSERGFNMGANGVAWSLLIANILQGISFRYFSVRESKFLNNKMAVKFVIYGVANYLICSYFFKHYFAETLILRLSFLPIYLLVTYLSFILAGWMKKNDLAQVLGLFNIKAMKNYISGELKDKNKNKEG